jgi:hypothetical protein
VSAFRRAAEGCRNYYLDPGGHSVVDEHTTEIIARYGELLDDPGSELDCVDQLSDVLVEALTAYELKARRSRPGHLTLAKSIAVPLTSMNVSLEVAGVTEPVTAAEIAQTGAHTSAGLRRVILSMRGFTEDAIAQTDDVIMLDRHHLEAMLAGLISPQYLLEATAQQATFEAQPYTTLTSLLVVPDPPSAPQCAPPDRVPPPWDLVSETADEVRVRQILGGQPGWPEARGMAVLDEQRLLLTTADGLITVHVRRGTADWFLPIRGLRGAPLVRSDGTVLVLLRHAVITYRDGKVIPVAGGFHSEALLAAGDDGSAWVLSRTTANSGTDPSQLSLTLAGDEFGRQQTYALGFNAAVHGMAWLQDRKLFLATGNESAVVDLSRTSTVRAR